MKRLVVLLMLWAASPPAALAATPTPAPGPEPSAEETPARGLPDTLEPASWPIPPTPDLLPPLTKFRPQPVARVEPKRWAISLGGGVAIPLPGSDHVVAPGPAALLEATVRLWGGLSLWAQTTISLLTFEEEVDVEPGYGRGLTAASGVVGAALSVPILEWMDANFAAGIGVGGFGVHGPVEALGLALDASAGLRMRFDRHLAVRVDLVPTVLIPTSGLAAGGHVSAVVRGELGF